MDNTMERLSELGHNYCSKIIGVEEKYVYLKGTKKLHFFYVFCNRKVRNYSKYYPPNQTTIMGRTCCSIHNKKDYKTEERIFMDKLTNLIKKESSIKKKKRSAKKESLRKKIYYITDKIFHG
jgi:hypothetical protein